MNEVPVEMYLTWQAVPPHEELTDGDEPSAGVLPDPMVAVSRRATRFEKSSPGFVQLTVICASPAPALAPLVPVGERLSMVTVVPAVSVPVCEFVPVHELIFAVTEYVDPGGTGMFA